MTQVAPTQPAYHRPLGQIRRLPTTYPVVPAHNLTPWLVQQAITHNLRWLLAHDDDGVIWGEVRQPTPAAAPGLLKRLFAPRQAPAPQLHLACPARAQAALRLDPTSLQQCRLFSEHGELFLWRGPGKPGTTITSQCGLQARLWLDAPVTDATDATDAQTWCLDERHWLWGWGSDTHDGFITLVEGTQGIVHAPPLTRAPTETARAKLWVRHYLGQDNDTGMYQISASRLAAVVEAD
ncbi:CRISPR-associated protein Csx19 [Candidatus Chloroploca sp. Khr17]|uniref:type III-D CRISPR-associated protein Csx19 n=1 Tax=Candidatus Chloroploca sp. Khr17 TaxID=2496869 RepID=UPI00101DA63A|nr:CRISPR-associated protein Csx19 [Candidatus Chloroploca sp. Khr17]